MQKFSIEHPNVLRLRCRIQLHWKETPTQVFSCEFCEIFKNSFFYRKPPVAGFERSQVVRQGLNIATRCKMIQGANSENSDAMIALL